MPDIKRGSIPHLAVRNELNRHRGVTQTVERMRDVTRQSEYVDRVALIGAQMIDTFYKLDDMEYSREQKYLHSLYVGMYIGHIATGAYEPVTIENLEDSFLPIPPQDNVTLQGKVKAADYLMRCGIARQRYNDGLYPFAMEAPLEEMSETKEEELVLSSLMAFGYSWSSGELRRGR